MTARHSTSKGCPRSPHRDTTERNKVELSPWTLSGAASALAGCPRTARRKATRNAGAKALRAGQRDESASCQAAGATVALAPTQRADMSCHQNKQTKRACTSKHSPVGALPLPTSYHIRRAGAQSRLAGARHCPITSREKSPKYPLAESLDSTKASGATVGYHN